MPRDPFNEHLPVWQHSQDWHDQYHARLNILRSRYPHLDARELHARALPFVASEPAPPKPAPEPERTKAQRNLAPLEVR